MGVNFPRCCFPIPHGLPSVPKIPANASDSPRRPLENFQLMPGHIKAAKAAAMGKNRLKNKLKVHLLWTLYPSHSFSAKWAKM